MVNRNFVFVQSGCLLPLLILINLIFGRLFFAPKTWVLVGFVLVLLFFINSVVLSRKILTKQHKGKDIIDVEGEVVKEKRRLK